ncbi:hypothetical protein MDAP_002109 [Mitosporidium daphniae]
MDKVKGKWKGKGERGKWKGENTKNPNNIVSLTVTELPGNSLFGHLKTWIKFVLPTSTVVFIRRVFQTIFYLAVLYLFSYEKFKNNLFDPLSTCEQKKITEITDLQTISESFTFEQTDKKIHRFFLVSEPENTSTNTGVSSPAAVDKTSKTMSIAYFFMEYVDFLAISQLFTVCIFICLKLLLGDIALKNTTLKTSEAVSIFLFSVDTLCCVYNKKYFPGIFCFPKELFEYHMQADERGLIARFFIAVYFVILQISIFEAAFMIFLDIMSSKTFSSEAILSIFAFLFYKYAPTFKQQEPPPKKKDASTQTDSLPVIGNKKRVHKLENVAKQKKCQNQ